jgi:hypothetical protein
MVKCSGEDKRAGGDISSCESNGSAEIVMK